MRKEAFDKIINLDIESLNENDYKVALEYYFTLKDEKLQNDFFDKYKIAVRNYLPTLLSKVEKYPVSYSYDRNVYKIDMLLFYTYTLYGDNYFDLFNTNPLEEKDNSIYFKCLERYRFLVTNELIDDKVFVEKLNIYNKEQELKDKYSSVDKRILEEAYNVYFTLDNYLEKEKYYYKKKNFVEKYNIGYDIFKDYVKAYAFLYLNISLEEINQKIRSISANCNRHTSNFAGLENSISDILQCNDLNNIKSIVFKYHITAYEAEQIINNYRSFIYSSEEKKNIMRKINMALSSLLEEHKYVHYSIALSKLENTNDLEEIKLVVKNNDNLLTHANIDRFISIYRMTLSEFEKEKLKRSLLDKIQMVKNDIKTFNKENTIIDAYNKINFEIFLNPDIKTIDEFCEVMNITRKEFDIAFERLETLDNEMYLRIKDKIHNLKKQRYAILSNKVNVIVDSIVNGIKVSDDEVRPFEILDYFIATKLEFNDFIDIYLNDNPNVSKEKLKIIKIFFAKNKLSTKIKTSTELSGTTVFMIDDNQYEVKQEEKIDTINYLNNNNIPLYTKVYKQALRRHVNGNLIKDEKVNTKH